MKKESPHTILAQKADKHLAGLTAELQSMDYMDEEGRAIGMGCHLVPLLRETFIAHERLTLLAVETMSLEEGDEPENNPAEIIKAFYQKLVTAIRALQAEGHDQAEDLAFGLILPHMNWLFCTHYAYWSAQMCRFDVLAIDPEAFNADHPQHVEITLKAFLQHTRKKDAKWSIRIAEKALQHITG